MAHPRRLTAPAARPERQGTQTRPSVRHRAQSHARRPAAAVARPCLDLPSITPAERPARQITAAFRRLWHRPVSFELALLQVKRPPISLVISRPPDNRRREESPCKRSAGLGNTGGSNSEQQVSSEAPLGDDTLLPWRARPTGVHLSIGALGVLARRALTCRRSPARDDELSPRLPQIRPPGISAAAAGAHKGAASQSMAGAAGVGGSGGRTLQPRPTLCVPLSR